jgi:pimeloyl-ACP methyl ester carboxylesterase
MNESQTRHLPLSDGRTLSYSDTGTGTNGTWIHCHGIPGSRHELGHITEDLKARGLRVIIPDRPGYGDSTPHPHYGFAQHSADLHQLADHLGLERFSVSGFSGGGVFAMATAHDIGERTEKLAIAATPAVPLMRDPFAYASELTAHAWQAALEDTDKLALELQALTESAESLSQALLDAVGDNERLHLLSKPVYQHFYTSLRIALKQSSAVAGNALARDSFLTAHQWPFHPENLNLPSLIIHGREDRLVHSQHQHTLIARIPGAKSRLVNNKGHYEVIPHIWRTIS